VAGIYFRHDGLRTQQKELIADAYSAIGQKGHLLAHAPVGMGKTDSLLSPAISYALEHNKTVFFLTPKISQHRIAMEVVQGLAKKYNLENLRAVDLIGRKYACIDPLLSDMDAEGFYQSCERRRKKEECAFFRNAKGFTRLDEARAERTFKKVERAYGCGMHHGQLVEMGREMEACPYEWLTKLASTSNVVVADYFHMMLPYIRDILLAKIKKKPSNSIIIVDEAHNLAKRVRDQLSFSTNSFLLSKMDKELKALGLKSNIASKFNRWAKYNLGEAREKLVMREMFFEAISNEQFTPGELADYLESCGEAFIEATNRKSFALRFSRFLREWIDSSDSFPSVRILRRRGGNFYLSKKALDPSSATSRMNDAHSAILTSGTLLPLEMHRDVLGLDPSRTKMRQYPSPFAKSNKLNIILEGFTTRYSRREPAEYKRMAQMLDSLVAQSPGGTALFFPSYKVMGAVLPFMESGSLHVQRERMPPSEVGSLLSDFRRGGTLCCVQGGSLSEGIDLCRGEIKTAVIVGIALEEMSLEVEALIDHYDGKFGRGWDYGYLYPGVIKAVQSGGRALRKESDRAVIIYMDERFKWKNYRGLLPKEETFTVTGEPSQYVDAFWAGGKRETAISESLGIKG
jgi:DNA excision repair protein ERCC-2